MNPTHANSWIDLVVKRAGELRAAGVRRIQIDECVVELAAPEGASAAPGFVEPAPEPDTSDPFNDPALYGRSDGTVPGLLQSEESP